ncbi:MAG: glycosyltransferase [Selenomonadaceae bacterium]|nr:glycosyltransferase [Selenomonadaceae bacterium]
MKISVIIPMYNAEKFLGVCLDSLLIQTLTDFEVLVVDDCSTDNSVAIAENYLEKFGGRLKIISLPENTGGGGIPRNVGLDFARGKYVCFLDSDDLLVDNALETLYTLAEKFHADATYMERGFTCDAEPVIPKKFNYGQWRQNLTDTEPTLETENIFVRVEKFITRQYKWPSWLKFSRRKFLLDNEIKFPDMKMAEDGIFSFKLICLAKNFLFVPPPLYVQRLNNNSVTRAEKSPEQDLIFRAKTLLRGADCLEEFMSRFEFFKQNPALRLRVIIFFLNVQLEEMERSLKALTPGEVYEIFWREFSKAGSLQPALISYLLLRPFVEKS